MATAEQVRAAVNEYVQSFVTADRDRFLGFVRDLGRDPAKRTEIHGGPSCRLAGYMTIRLQPRCPSIAQLGCARAHPLKT